MAQYTRKKITVYASMQSDQDVSYTAKYKMLSFSLHQKVLVFFIFLHVVMLIRFMSAVAILMSMHNTGFHRESRYSFTIRLV